MVLFLEDAVQRYGAIDTCAPHRSWTRPQCHLKAGASEHAGTLFALEQYDYGTARGSQDSRTLNRLSRSGASRAIWSVTARASNGVRHVRSSPTAFGLFVRSRCPRCPQCYCRRPRSVNYLQSPRELGRFRAYYTQRRRCPHAHT